jgi:hypothetical protein
MRMQGPLLPYVHLLVTSLTPGLTSSGRPSCATLLHMRHERVHFVVAAEERAAYRAAAEREGLSLSGWLRAAAADRLEAGSREDLESLADLDEFFAACDAREGDTAEPDWDEHLAVIADSRRGAT